jgi:hypothetical protein
LKRTGTGSEVTCYGNVRAFRLRLDRSICMFTAEYDPHWTSATD